jgi:hypothetical protein
MNKNLVTEFLYKHRCFDTDTPTHLSYGKFAGKFKLDKTARKEFMKLYISAVESGVNDLSILEKQLEYGPILIDIDIKQKKENYTDGRLYDDNDIEAIINKYVRVIDKYIDIKNYKIGVFEKPKPTIKENEIKDGFHLVISDIIACSDVKHQIRNEVIDIFKLDGTFSNYDNDISDIIDKAVVSSNSWFLYGSVKPGFEAYKLSNVYHINNNKLDKYSHDDFEVSDIISAFSIQSSLYKKDKQTPLKVNLPTKVEKPVQVQTETDDKILLEIEEKVLKMLDKDDNVFKSNSEWIGLQFIIYNESGGSVEGLKLFDLLSQKIKGYAGYDTISKNWWRLKPTSSDKKKTIKSIRYQYREMFPDEKEEIIVNSVYDKDKIIFEQKVFKLNNPICYIIEEDEGFQSINSNDLNEWAKGKFKPIIENEKSKKITFVDKWRDDPIKREYDKIDFEPNIESIKNKKIYNLFKGFNNNPNITNEATQENSYFLKHLKRVCKGDVEFEYFKQWIAHIIQKPYIKTGKAIILYSEKKGSGKNSIIEGLIKLFSSELVGKMNNIEDITRNFNAHLVNKLLIFGDEITAKAKAINDRLKSVITQEDQNLEKKGKDAIKVKDCTNYIFTSNNREAFKVEDDDRRLFLIHLLEEEMINKNEFYEYINNKNSMSELFNYFKNYKITYKIVEDKPPLTEYKLELQMDDKPSYFKYVFLKPEVFTTDYTTNELYLKVKDWAKKEFLNSSFSITSFGVFMNKLFGDYKKKSHGVMTYNFNDLNCIDVKKILYNFDKVYYKYINDIDSSDEPIFE